MPFASFDKFEISRITRSGLIALSIKNAAVNYVSHVDAPATKRIQSIPEITYFLIQTTLLKIKRDFPFREHKHLLSPFQARSRDAYVYFIPCGPCGQTVQINFIHPRAQYCLPDQETASNCLHGLNTWQTHTVPMPNRKRRAYKPTLNYVHR